MLHTLRPQETIFRTLFLQRVRGVRPAFQYDPIFLFIATNTQHTERERHRFTKHNEHTRYTKTQTQTERQDTQTNTTTNRHKTQTHRHTQHTTTQTHIPHRHTYHTQAHTAHNTHTCSGSEASPGPCRQTLRADGRSRVLVCSSARSSVWPSSSPSCTDGAPGGSRDEEPLLAPSLVVGVVAAAEAMRRVRPFRLGSAVFATALLLLLRLNPVVAAVMVLLPLVLLLPRTALRPLLSFRGFKRPFRTGRAPM